MKGRCLIVMNNNEEKNRAAKLIIELDKKVDNVLSLIRKNHQILQNVVEHNNQHVEIKNVPTQIKGVPSPIRYVTGRQIYMMIKEGWDLERTCLITAYSKEEVQKKYQDYINTHF